MERTNNLSLDLLDQGGKDRIIVDARYPNGGTLAMDIRLPQLAEIVAEITEGCLMAKIDLKTGYHQLGLHQSCWGETCFIWRGKIWHYNVVTLGTRDAPSCFQRMTETMARHLEAKFRGLRVFVYLDDFIFLWRDRSRAPPNLQDIWAEFREAGMVLGADKCSTTWTTELHAGLAKRLSIASGCRVGSCALVTATLISETCPPRISTYSPAI